MGLNTVGRLQVYELVDPGLPNEGNSSYEDAPLKFERDFKVQSIVASDLNSAADFIDLNQYKTFNIVVDEAIDFIASMFTGAFDGADGILVIQQDGTGGFAVTLNAAAFAFSLDIPSVTFQTGANKMDLLGIKQNDVLGKLLTTAFNGGFN